MMSVRRSSIDLHEESIRKSRSPWRERIFNTVLRLSAAAASGSRERRRLLVLTYHRVLEAEDPLLEGTIDVKAFDRQMRIVGQQFRVLGLGDAVQRLMSGSLPSRAVCVTFDDGYRDNVELALPVLQRYGVRASFFVATGFLDGGIMWNDAVIESIRQAPEGSIDLGAIGLGREDLGNAAGRRALVARVLDKLKYLEPGERGERVTKLTELTGASLPNALMMTSEHVRQLAKQGMDIGAHTVSHPILTSVPNVDAEHEIKTSKEQLEGLIDAPISIFAYPNGRPGRDYNTDHVRMVREAGFDAAVSTSWGAASGDADPLQIPRVGAWDPVASRFAMRLVRDYRTTPEAALNG